MFQVSDERLMQKICAGFKCPSVKKTIISLTIDLIQVKVDMCMLSGTLYIWQRFKKEHSIYSSPEQAQV